MKRLLSTLKEKWPEYLLESIVIVASILGAIALENWNENLNQLQEEKSILRIVKEDLLKDVELIESHEMQLRRTLQVLDSLSFALIDSEKLKSNLIYVKSFAGFPDIALSTRGWELIQSSLTGSNSSITLPSEVHQFYLSKKIGIDVFTDQLQEDLSNNFNHWKSNYGWFGSYMLAITSDEEPNKQVINYMLNDSDFTNRLMFYKILHQGLLDSHIDFKNEALKLTKRIEKALGE